MTSTETGFAPVEQGQLCYDKTGEGPAVVLLHGFAIDRRSWEDQIAPLSERYTVIAYDLRGFGESSMPDGPYRPHDDLAALLDHLGIAQASLVGSSMGARIAFDFAIAYPERTRVVISADGVPSGWNFNRRPGAKRGPDRAQAARTLASMTPERQLWFRAIARDYSRWHHQNEDPRQELDPPAIERLGEVMAPTLLLVGDDDGETYHKAAAMLALGVARSRKSIITNSGHLPNLEAPDEFNRQVLEFLDLNRRYALSR
jgi:pimeloyl-ACP methyl ester carboxylesterase